MTVRTIIGTKGDRMKTTIEVERDLLRRVINGNSIVSLPAKNELWALLRYCDDPNCAGNLCPNDDKHGRVTA